MRVALAFLLAATAGADATLERRDALRLDAFLEASQRAPRDDCEAATYLVVDPGYAEGCSLAARATSASLSRARPWRSRSIASAVASSTAWQDDGRFGARSSSVASFAPISPPAPSSQIASSWRAAASAASGITCSIVAARLVAADQVGGFATV